MWSAICRTGSSLRTWLRLRSGGPPVQVVSDKGEVPLEIVDTAGDPAEVADQLWNHYHEVDFDCADEFPVRMAAAQLLAARNVVPTSPVLLAAFAVTLDRVTGVRPVVAQVVVSNRFRPGLADRVSTIGHPGPRTLDVAAVRFDEPDGAVPAAAEVRAALPRTTLRRVRPLDPVSEPFFFHLNDVPGVLDVRLTLDARRGG